MKNKLLILLFSMVPTSLLFAQSFGIKAGANVSNLTNNQGTATTSRVGFHAGLLANIPLGSSFYLQPEAVYSNQGFKYTQQGGNYSGLHSVSMNYVNIPLLLQYGVGSGFYLETGPQLGLLTNVQDKLNGVNTGLLATGDFKSTDVSWAFGGAFKSRSGLGLDVRYNVGLSNVRNDPAYNSTIRNGVFQAGLFYMFSTSYRR